MPHVLEQARRLSVLTFVVLMLSAAAASAQAIVPQRDCQTLLKCQYAKGASFRGCISTYSCKTCRLVPGRCDLAGARNCLRMNCGWGA